MDSKRSIMHRLFRRSIVSPIRLLRWNLGWPWTMVEKFTAGKTIMFRDRINRILPLTRNTERKSTMRLKLRLLKWSSGRSSWRSRSSIVVLTNSAHLSRRSQTSLLRTRYWSMKRTCSQVKTLHRWQTPCHTTIQLGMVTQHCVLIMNPHNRFLLAA